MAVEKIEEAAMTPERRMTEERLRNYEIMWENEERTGFVPEIIEALRRAWKIMEEVEGEIKAEKGLPPGRVIDGWANKLKEGRG